MEYLDLLPILARIKGCTFASLDAVTFPKAGLRKVIERESVIIFTNKKSSGYENMVRRRLALAGKDPDSFVLGDLPWGTRVPGTPLIMLEDRYYLQTILLKPGEAKFYVGNHAVDPADFGIKPERTNQGLPKGKEVFVHTYALSSIVKIRLMGDEVTETKRPTLGVKF